MTIEEVASRLPSRSTRVRRPWLVAVTAMGAVLLLVGGMAVLFGGRAADPSHPGGAPSTVGEPSEDEAAVGGALSWRRIELAADGGQVASVVEFAGEFFVRPGTGSWFRSTDTVAWEEYTPGGDLDPGEPADVVLDVGVGPHLAVQGGGVAVLVGVVAPEPVFEVG